MAFLTEAFTSFKIKKILLWGAALLPACLMVSAEKHMKMDIVELIKIILVPIIVGALSVWVMADRVSVGLEYHINDKAVHMPLKEKMKVFVTRDEFTQYQKNNENHFHEVLRAIEKIDGRTR